MYINTGEPSHATPGAPPYFVRVSWRVLGVGRKIPPKKCEHKMGTIFVIFSVEVSRRKSATESPAVNTIFRGGFVAMQ